MEGRVVAGPLAALAPLRPSAANPLLRKHTPRHECVCVRMHACACAYACLPLMRLCARVRIRRSCARAQVLLRDGWVGVHSAQSRQQGREQQTRRRWQGRPRVCSRRSVARRADRRGYDPPQPRAADAAATRRADSAAVAAGCLCVACPRHHECRGTWTTDHYGRGGALPRARRARDPRCASRSSADPT